MSTEEQHFKYIESNLVDIIQKQLENETIQDYKTNCCNSLNGFMSAIYNLELFTEDNLTKKKLHRKIFVKFMKGNEQFRTGGRVDIQFANEIYIYSKVIPYFDKILKASEKSKIDISNWIPTVYLAKYGEIEGLGTEDTGPDESVLALENLTATGFRCGPRLLLDRQHLLLMTKLIAEYHSLTYALRIRKDGHLETLIDGIIPFSFISEGEKNSLYDAAYPPAFERIFGYFDRTKDSIADSDFIANMNKLRERYGTSPTHLMERFRETDDIFSVILHGDYNRNNVLFQYDQENGFDNPKDIRMFDFQELRYGTPAIDLSFFMYMNMEPSIRKDFWMELLRIYHSTVISSLADILDVDVEHGSLKPYSFEKFYEHFSKYAFYGVCICLHFLPVMYSSEEECAELSFLFETDMHGKAFKEKAIELGGDRVNEIILDIVHDASEKGYMNYILNN